ncbi:TetR/AcrR family transcriptional regulator [Sphingomonas sp. So64.6b]|uniref:TetR/AcrR family transcriptional regulator n=1 Tax=Sphingomonas sp. So64.6b TaxID=2997354 RepID=UPI001600DE7F|nr:TetR/AcrR family transcriptional regulator [Sphingomonas sp. So64.6b]QNA86334.1 TetR/AcrR family transcriptional regulator [Sphingomonas sp. So64.6b]
MTGRATKASAEDWIEAAEAMLIETGASEVKVDRVSRRIRVTRGSFYHYFKDREDLLDCLLKRWEEKNLFISLDEQPTTQSEAKLAIITMSSRLQDERHFNPELDLAVRDWARNSPKAARAVRRVDKQRMADLTRLLETLGYDGKEASMRARIYYFHQIGYYGMRLHEQQTKKARREELEDYLGALCGRLYRETPLPADAGN